MIDKHKGAWAELMAQAALLKLGYEVFINSSSHGPIDMIALHVGTKQTRLFDVKMAGTRKIKLSDGYETTKLRLRKWILTDEQKRLGVELLVVTPGGVCLFEDEIEELRASESSVESVGGDLLYKPTSEYPKRTSDAPTGS